MKAPLLVVHGARDPRVPQREADQIVQELRSDGKQVAYMLNEGHGFRKKENQLEMFRAIEQFLALHLGGRKEEKPNLLSELYNFNNRRETNSPQAYARGIGLKLKNSTFVNLSARQS